MKKFLVVAALFVTLFSVAVQASEGTGVSRRVEESFKKEFAGARAVKWDLIEKENIFQARFILNNERLNAFFDADGNLIATGRYISVSALPLLVRKSVYHKYNNYQVKEVIEYITGYETSYLVSLENERSKLLVQAYNSGAAYIFKKEKKNEVAKKNDVAGL